MCAAHMYENHISVCLYCVAFFYKIEAHHYQFLDLCKKDSGVLLFCSILL